MLFMLIMMGVGWELFVLEGSWMVVLKELCLFWGFVMVICRVVFDWVVLIFFWVGLG